MAYRKGCKVSLTVKAMISVSAAGNSEFELPELVDGDPVDRDKTRFYVSTADHGLAVFGTFDEIIDFASAILASMYSWPLVTGRTDWFTAEDSATIREGLGYGNGTDKAGSGREDGGDCAPASSGSDEGTRQG